MEEDEEGETCTTASLVGVPRDPCGHADGTVRAYESSAKWIDAALLRLHRERGDFLMGETLEPNDALCSQVHGLLATWSSERVPASQCGVVCDDAFLHRPPPQQILVKARNWMLRYMNTRRAEEPHRLPALPSDWGERLAGRRGDTRMVNQQCRERRASSGDLYHTRREIAPTFDQIISMTYCGFTCDQRVDADELSAMESGVSIALYYATGARGSELKKMRLQSIGTTPIEDTQTGLTFHSFQLVAYGTKTKAEHLNSLLPHSHPWLDGVGLLGLSILLRVKARGPPPFEMATTGASWNLLGSNVDTLDRRLRDCFAVAGLRRQKGDPVTYLGRHDGTRRLQHAGGSSDGGAARTGHAAGTARHHYTTMPLHDQLRLAGNFASAPFVPAHQRDDLGPLADAVLEFLFAPLALAERALDRRQREVDAMPGDRDRVRTAEHLNDLERFLRALRLACRTGVCCLVARPRTWKRWRIEESGTSVWNRASCEDHRLVRALFSEAGEAGEAAVGRMNVLAAAVGRHEADELRIQALEDDRTAERASTVNVELTIERALQSQLAPAIASIQTMLQAQVSTSFPPPPPREEEGRARGAAGEASRGEKRAAAGEVSTASSTAPRKKLARTTQEDVVHFSSWASVADALEYALTELAPRERADGAKWRILPRSDGREDRARHKQWTMYKQLASAVGLLEASGHDRARAVEQLQAALSGARSHRQFLSSLPAVSDAVALRVLGVSAAPPRPGKCLDPSEGDGRDG